MKRRMCKKVTIDAQSPEATHIFIKKGLRVVKDKQPSLAESFRESFESPTFILSSIVVTVSALRFLFDGATATILGQQITFAHTDPMAYASILTPVLGAHSYIRAKAKITQVKNLLGAENGRTSDDPDAN